MLHLWFVIMMLQNVAAQVAVPDMENAVNVLHSIEM